VAGKQSAVWADFFPCSPIYSYGLPNGAEIVHNLVLRNANRDEMLENADPLRHKISLSRKTKLPHSDSFSEPYK